VTPARLLLLVALAAGLWLLQRLSAIYGVFGGSPVGRVLEVAAAAAGAALAVAVLGTILLDVGLGVLLRVRPTGVHRVVAFGLLTLAAVIWVFAAFGVDVAALITTSAIFAAAMGLALQPTLGGLIAGMVMHGDVLLRRGDAVIVDGEMIEIQSFGWRSVTGTAGGGTRLVVPNAMLVDKTLHVFPRAEPARLDTEFQVPLNVAPERIERLVTELVSDMAVVELTRPITVMLLAFDPQHGLARYRLRYWVRDILNKSSIEAEALRRIWHGFQREQIPWPVPSYFDPGLHEWSAVAKEHRDVLLFAPGERVILPARYERSRLTLASGELRISPAIEVLSMHLGRAMLWAEQTDGPLTREAALRRVSDKLAEAVGPYAEFAVSEAALVTPSIDAVVDKVAVEIDDEAARTRFLAAFPRQQSALLGPGFSFKARRDSAGRLVSDPPTRAATYATLLGSPVD
jgi:small-conductance mechanosensitive channel